MAKPNRRDAAKTAFQKLQEKQDKINKENDNTSASVSKDSSSNVPSSSADDVNVTTVVKKEQQSNKGKAVPKKNVSIPLDIYNKCKILTMLPDSEFEGMKVVDIITGALEVILYQEKYKKIFEQFDNLKVE